MKMNFARTFAQLALRYGDHEALVNIERNRRYSFAGLHRLTNRIVNMMRERLQLRRGDVYLCMLENDNLSLLHTWTALKGEAAVAYTNLRDAQDEHRAQVELLRPKVVFLENLLLERYFDWLHAAGITVVCMDPPAVPREGLYSFDALLEGIGDHDPGIQSDTREDVLVYRFTGGTTGKSKCAQYTLDNWLACRDAFYAESEQAFDAATRLLHMAPISHGSGLSLLATLFRGGCTLTQNAPDLALWCRNIEAERVTVGSLVPTLLYRLLDLPAATDHDLSSLQTVYYGAAPMSPSRLAQLQQRFGNLFVQIYGATECLQPVATLGKADHLLASEAGRLASAGRVAPGVEVMIVDEHGFELDAGGTGEVWLRSRATIGGYHGNPEATAAEFTEGFWKSGDLGYIDEQGYLFIVDRKKDMIITGGFNVYAVEVEAALNAHPDVALSAVVGIPHAQWGEAVHAEVVARAGTQPSLEALIEHVKARLGRFKAPKSVVLVNELPISPVGKVLRRQVRDKYWKDQARSVS
ncbi:AMP-binding protein [Pseudomonas sp. JQ170]|uniref:class I adenylate-forming enzyme family protein n=1 Tax=unclassified Pseudomonas TaxID=196821 RepID=UPI00265224E8|nr:MULTISPECIES: AMP-binding protein [unclassified Pseudomonas]MDN7139808.1 AMP-binding protein [Pseudomonas sp. JQ170]WRO73738.1 AMP-binding protein [Pseudomonas sp. 170C]